MIFSASPCANEPGLAVAIFGCGPDSRHSTGRCCPALSISALSKPWSVIGTPTTAMAYRSWALAATTAMIVTQGAVSQH